MYKCPGHHLGGGAEQSPPYMCQRGKMAAGNAAAKLSVQKTDSLGLLVRHSNKRIALTKTRAKTAGHTRGAICLVATHGALTNTRTEDHTHGS